MDATIIYYTSNREHEGLETKVKDNILKVSDLPIISVSHEPIDFGENICVGKHEATGFNMFRQVLIGCKAAKTDWIISAEADCLYPPDYFTFRPERKDICYRDSNLYVMGDHRRYFWHKPNGATHAQIVDREFYIKTLEALFEGAPEWSDTEKNFPKERWRKDDVFRPAQIQAYQTENPVVQIKTHKGMRFYTQSERVPIYELPYWGDSRKFRKHYLA